ncbi:hypothetical protein BpHYR1_009583 [Brachionus plicatilis]|nr:hypothetical protein BpHYR1_009583 [Brachionus plicatilis]
MGCGATKDPRIAVADSQRPLANKNKNGFRQVEVKNNYDNSRNAPNQANIKAPLAFEIKFDESNNTLAKRPPPGRLRLEPLKHTPTTRAEIEEKMKIAEIKREKILADRAKSTSGKKKKSVSNRRENSDSGFEVDSLSRNDSFNRINQRPDSYEKDNEKKQRLLNRRRIVPDYDDDDTEHDRNFNRDSDDF